MTDLFLLQLDKRGIDILKPLEERSELESGKWNR